MIGASKHRVAIETLQDGVAAIDTRVGTLDDRTTSLSNRLAERTAQAADDADRIASLVDRMVCLEALIAAQAETLAMQNEALAAYAATADEHAAEIARLREGAERHDETVKQVRADLTRMERQAAIDLDEMRRTGNALAATILRHSARSTMPSEPTVPPA